jgi:spermidine/putrescine-binding protein
MRDTLFRRTLALMAIALMALAAGCSTIRFSYNQGDTLLYWCSNGIVRPSCATMLVYWAISSKN